MILFLPSLPGFDFCNCYGRASEKRGAFPHNLMCPQRFSQTSGGTRKTRLHPPCFPQRHPAATRQRWREGTEEGGPQSLSESKKWRGSLVSSSPSPLPQSKVPLSILVLPWVDRVQPYIYTQRAQLAGNVSKKGGREVATSLPGDFPVADGGFNLCWVTLAAPGTADVLNPVFLIVAPMTLNWL